MLLTIPMGPLQANCYLLYRKEGGDALLLDPSDADAALSALAAHGLKLTHILLTHRHFDHIAGVSALREKTSAEVLIHPLDAVGLTDADAARATWMGGVLTPCEPTRLISDDERIAAAGYEWRVLYTPGHTAGGVCYWLEQEQIAFTGDTVFRESFGRTDLPTGDLRTLMHSAERVLSLPEDTILYPGHGEPTTVRHESQYNPILRYRRSPWFN